MRYVQDSASLFGAPSHGFGLRERSGGGTLRLSHQGAERRETEKDKSEFYTWAKQQTGFDPMQAPQAAPPPPPSSPQHQGQVVEGAARGAALGAIGAAAGGGLGAMRKRSSWRNEQAQYQQQVEQQQAQYQQKRSDYDLTKQQILSSHTTSRKGNRTRAPSNPSTDTR
jgi:hypothetical protein